MKHDFRTHVCVESIAATEHLSDRWIAPFIQLQSFLATMDEVYASIEASGGSALIQVTRGSLQRQFDSVRGICRKGPLKLSVVNRCVVDPKWLMEIDRPGRECNIH